MWFDCFYICTLYIYLETVGHIQPNVPSEEYISIINTISMLYQKGIYYARFFISLRIFLGGGVVCPEINLFAGYAWIEHVESRTWLTLLQSISWLNASQVLGNVMWARTPFRSVPLNEGADDVSIGGKIAQRLFIWHCPTGLREKWQWRQNIEAQAKS